MRQAPVLFVTGKGGSGKTTIACTLAGTLADHGERVLLVEALDDGGIGRHFPGPEVGDSPRAIADRLDGVVWQPRALVEAYFGRVLRLPILTRRLFSSDAFNALTTAAPGIAAFLALDQVYTWSASREYDRIIVDSPATGHALQLLRAPFQLAAVVARGPLHTPLERITARLRNRKLTSVAVVALCEEMSVAEAAEAAASVKRLGLRLERPILNCCAEARFTAADRKAIDELSEIYADDRLLAAARQHLAAQRRTATFARELRQIFAAQPLRLVETGIDEDVGAGIESALRRWSAR